MLTQIRKSIGGRIERWQKSRSPLALEANLTQNNTYILPTRYGFLMALVILLMGIGATNYQNNLMFIATFFALTLGLMSIVLTNANLVGLHLSAHQIAPIFSGQRFHFPVSLSSKKDHLAISIGFANQPLQTVDVFAGEEQRIDIGHIIQQRGVYRVDRIKCQTLYPFGFLLSWSWVFFDRRVVVYPKPIEPVDAQQISSGSNTQYSDDFKPGTEDFYGLRAYQPGDAMSRVNWKSFAKDDELKVKEFVDYSAEPSIINYFDFPNHGHEQILSFMTYLVLDSEKSKRAFGVRLPNEFIEDGQGNDHLHRCLRAMAEA